MIIDVFGHVAPQKFLDALLKKGEIKELPPALNKLDPRFELMDEFEGMVQILSLPIFDFASLDNILSPEENVELCKLANDGMADLIVKYPDRFIGACAAVPMTDIEAALLEIDRAINDLRFCGIEIFIGAKGMPIDSPEFKPIFEKMNSYNLPILLHPAKEFASHEHPKEKTSKYLSITKLTFPYQTTLALVDLVYSGIMEDYPNLKIVTHHCGGLLPFVAGRISSGAKHKPAAKGAIEQRNLSQDPSKYFHRFYADTGASSSKITLICGFQYFGATNLLFGTDTPFGKIGANISVIEELDIGEEDKRRIYELNAKDIFRLSLNAVT